MGVRRSWAASNACSTIECASVRPFIGVNHEACACGLYASVAHSHGVALCDAPPMRVDAIVDRLSSASNWGGFVSSRPRTIACTRRNPCIACRCVARERTTMASPYIPCRIAMSCAHKPVTGRYAHMRHGACCA